MHVPLPAPVCLFVSQDNHEVFLTNASYEPDPNEQSKMAENMIPTTTKDAGGRPDYSHNTV
ncbi:hypothetical protein PENSOL_c062G03971 [Penicillium solitum]|uniref:Uncharacterized protein n=1 Tax=Penicillium solitum TaxID=60172 RepID=A0A1V6QLG8_9EURO|nr:uncharacterized protein PENSOL_c062G03971 [Penicillium solitum]OQD90079.1 hypothetical protein PENSOL_c062G03971 [Penicillium solitum]